MRVHTAVAALLTATVIIGCQTSNPSIQQSEKDAVEEMLLDWTQQWGEVLVSRDPTVLETILGDDCQACG